MTTTPFLARVVLAAAIAASLPSIADAQTLGCVTGGPGGAFPTSGTGGGGTYPDTLPLRELVLPLVVGTVPVGSTCVTEVRILGLTHPWMDDVQFVLTDPSGAMHNIVCRTGHFTCGYGGDYTIVGQCQGSNTYPTSCAGPTVLAPGSYEQDFGDWPDVSPLSIFNTPLDSIPAMAGTWTLTAYDWLQLHTGVLTGWELCFGTPPPRFPPTSAPTLTRPIGGAWVNALPVTLQWAAVACASSYDVDIDGVVTPNVTGTSLNISVAVGTHGWAVRGVSAWGAGPWSSSAAFSLAAPPAMGFCVTGGPGGVWPIGGSNGTWPTTLPTGQFDSALVVTVPAGSTQIVAIKLLGFNTTFVGDQHFVLEDPVGGMHNVFYRPGSAGNSYGFECDALGGDYTIVDAGSYSHPSPLACSGSEFDSGVYEQNFGDWPNGSATVFNTALSWIPVQSGTYTLHCYDWYVASDDGSITGWELCFDAPAGPVAYCALTSPGSSNHCMGAISANANPNVAHSTTCIVTVTDVEAGQSGIVFYGLAGYSSPWCSGGNSTLCVKTPLERLGVQNTGGLAACTGTLTFDWNAYQIATPGAPGQPWAAGNKAYVQGWVRDPPSCKTTILTPALQLTYDP